MARRMTAGAIGLFLGSAGLVALVPESPPAGALGPAPTIRQFAGAAPTPYRAPDSLVKLGDALYITDEHGIDRVDLVTNDVVVVTGDRMNPGSKNGAFAEARFANPSGIATDGQNLYVADTNNHTVRKIDLANQRVSTIAGTPGASGAVDGVGWGARFNHPTSVSVSADGTRLFVADKDNVTVRAVDLATRQVTTLAGTAGQTGTTDGIGAAARFLSPRAMTTDGDVLWVTDDNRIRKILVATGEVSTLPTTGFGLSDTFTGISSNDSYLYVVNIFDDDDDRDAENYEIDKVTGSARYLPGDFNRGGYAVFAADSQTVYFAGDWYRSAAFLFVLDLPTNTIHNVGGYAEHDNVDGVGPAARFSFPDSMASDGTNLYVGDSYGIRKVTPAGAVTLVTPDVYVGSDMATDGVNLYKDAGNSVRKVVLATGQETTLVTFSGGYSDFVQGVALSGNYLFISHTNCAIYKYNLVTSALTLHSGQPGSCTHVDGPVASARYASGGRLGVYGDDLFLVESLHTIRGIKISTGNASTIADHADGLAYPDDVSSDGTYVYTASGSSLDVTRPRNVVKVSIATGAVTVLTGEAPLTYTSRAASLTRAGDSVYYGGQLTDVTVLSGGHNVYFLNEQGVGVITDAKVPAQLGVGDVSVVEGDGGTGLANFTVRLSSPQPATVTVNYTTADNVAIAGSDYVAAAGSLTFPPGVVEKQVQVSVNGDADDEADEVFKLKLSAPVGAVLARLKGKATILDDDPGGGVALSVGDAKVVEGDDLTARATFTVRLSAPQPGPVTVNFATADGSATTAGGDYQARLGTATFAAGQTSKNVFVTVNGDYAVEAQETFTLTISGSSGPTITRATGTGRISPDD